MLFPPSPMLAGDGFIDLIWLSLGSAPAPRQPPAGGVRPLLGGIAAMLNAGAQVAVGLMIETVTGVENAAAIAAQPGVDYLLIGTGDLALSRGTSDPDVIARDCARVWRRPARGLPCGIYTGSAEAARQAHGQLPHGGGGQRH